MKVLIYLDICYHTAYFLFIFAMTYFFLPFLCLCSHCWYFPCLLHCTHLRQSHYLPRTFPDYFHEKQSSHHPCSLRPNSHIFMPLLCYFRCARVLFEFKSYVTYEIVSPRKPGERKETCTYMTFSVWQVPHPAHWRWLFHLFLTATLQGVAGKCSAHD